MQLVKRVLLADNPRFSTKKTCLQVVNFESAFDVFKVSIITDMSVDNLMPLKVIVESTTLAARLSNRLLMALARWAADVIIGCE